MSVAEGQSGSPVYLSDGTVVGILKSEDNEAAGVGYMVPIEFADALIAHLRLRELDKQLAALGKEIGWKQGDSALSPRLTNVEKGIQDVSTNFLWHAQFIDGQVILDYNKLISGAPQIKNVLLKIVPLVTNLDTNEVNRKEPLIIDGNQDSRIVTVNPDGKGGRVIVQNIGQLISYRTQSTAHTSIAKLDISVIATLDDQSQHRLDPVQVPIDIEVKKQ